VSLSVYVASPFSNAVIVRMIHERIVAAGMRVTSSWGETALGPEDWSRFSAEELERAIARNDADVIAADVVFLHDPTSEGRETYAEARFALAIGKPVVWHGPRGLSRWRKNVIRVDDTDAGLCVLGSMNAKHADGLRGELLALAVSP
jgi:hypothetical protein